MTPSSRIAKHDAKRHVDIFLVNCICSVNQLFRNQYVGYVDPVNIKIKDYLTIILILFI